MKIDVCIPTWNSDNCMEKCLQSIYDYININKVYILDKYSTDRTLAIIDDFNTTHNNIEVIQDNGNLAVARQILINKVTTDFLLFIDADVEVKNGIYEDFLSRIDEDTGAVAYPVELTGWCMEEKYVLALEKIGIQNKDTRGFTYCTFIRKKVVENILIPPERYAFEDQFICDYIKQHGFKWLIPKNKLAIHYNDHGNWRDRLRFKVNSGRATRRFTENKGGNILKREIKQFLGIIIYSCIAAFISLDPRMFAYMVTSHLLLRYGYYTSSKSQIYQNRDKINKSI